ncbi:MAG: hypothetical protein ABSG04_11970 [Verrucomicrobiota bacterium]|jgi:hypothetical protein
MALVDPQCFAQNALQKKSCLLCKTGLTDGNAGLAANTMLTRKGQRQKLKLDSEGEIGLLGFVGAFQILLLRAQKSAFANYIIPASRPLHNSFSRHWKRRTEARIMAGQNHISVDAIYALLTYDSVPP